MALTFKTNHAYRFFVYRSDVPAKVLADQFDHLAEDDALDGFFCYRGRWYHLSDFMRFDHNEDLADWDGYAADSMFSGVVIKLSDDCERYKVATYFS